MYLECSMRNFKSPIAMRNPKRHGMTALIAMLYLGLIASLAVGFYASANSAAMVSDNEKRTNLALMSCESGMDFMRFHLSQLSIPHGGSESQRMTAVCNQLKSQLENTGNFGSKTISLTGTTISIPSNANEYIQLDPSGGQFRATIQSLSIGEDGKVHFGGGASIGGTSNPAEIRADHIHTGVSAPEFPTIDTDAFKAYATNVYSGGTTLVNVRIPANTNPKFNAGVNIQGVLYIETPNNITFNGNVNVQGVIVTQNNPIGNLSTNILNFSGNVSAQPVNTLPESFGDLRKLTGSFLLAQGFQANFTGSFGTVNGAIIADKVSFGGNAGGTVMGSIVSLTSNPLTVSGTADVIIASTGTTDYPAGVYFSSRYTALADTYEEVKP